MRVTWFTAKRPPLVLTPSETVLLHALAPMAISFTATGLARKRGKWLARLDLNEHYSGNNRKSYH